MSVRKRAGFLYPDRISEMVFDSESEETGASSNCVIYVGNGIVCIFRQPLKYLRFSYSFLDEIRKYDVETHTVVTVDYMLSKSNTLKETCK